jgi:hypothetical protein
VIQSIAADHDKVTLIGSLGFWYKQPWDSCTRVDKQIIPESWSYKCLMLLVKLLLTGWFAVHISWALLI